MSDKILSVVGRHNQAADQLAKTRSYQELRVQLYRVKLVFCFSVKIHDLVEMKDIYAIITLEDAGGNLV